MFKNTQHRFRQRPNGSAASRQPRLSRAGGSANLVNYHQSRSIRQQKPNRRKLNRDNKLATRHNKLRRITVAVLFILILIFAIDQIGLSRQPKIVILPSSANASSYLKSQAVYRQAAAELMSKASGSFTKITINSAGLADRMLAKFPEIKNVSLVLPVLGHRTIFYLQPATPALIITANNQTSYLVAVSGRVLLKTAHPNIFSQLKLPLVSAQTSELPSVNNQAMPRSDVAFIQLVQAQFKAAGIGVGAMILPPASRELDVRPSGEPYFVKFNLQDYSDAKLQIGGLLAVRHYLSSKGQTPTQYVDARLPGRVYYK